VNVPELSGAAASANAPGRRGRPLDADRTPAILDAVLELLKDSGYDQLRVQDVAEHAGVGLGTIYRRWPNKQALVIEALQCGRFIDEKLVDTGDPAGDLVATLLNLATSMAGQGDVIGFIASIRREPDIATAWRAIAVCNLRDRLRDLVVAARQCDPDDPALDTVTDLGPALLLYRIAVVGDTDDVEALAHDAARTVLAYPMATARSDASVRPVRRATSGAIRPAVSPA
jgi:AcrR family transcriptional regulator